MITISLTESQALTVLRGVLATILPSIGAANIVLGQVNRVPQVTSADFVVQWPIRRGRLSTNVDTSSDCAYIASIAGTVMTVTDVMIGLPAAGTTVFGVDAAANTAIVAPLIVNPDGTGTYTVSPSQTVTSQKLASGTMLITQDTQLTVQLDVHGPNSGDNAQIISTLLRDQYGVGLFNSSVSGVETLYADDPRQMPYVNENDQVEMRWIVISELQIAPCVTVPQQFSDVLTPNVIEIDAAYPPV